VRMTWDVCYDLRSIDANGRGELEQKRPKDEKKQRSVSKQSGEYTLESIKEEQH